MCGFVCVFPGKAPNIKTTGCDAADFSDYICELELQNQTVRCEINGDIKFRSLVLMDTGLADVGDGQTESYLKDMGMAGLASAWAMVRRSPI